MQNNSSITMINTSLIIPNKYQPRKVFDEASINSLANSIKTYGIINPILVRQKDDKYEIIAGERRFRAAKLLGLTEIPVIIKNATEQQMAELALIENLERQNLNPIEEAKSYEEIMRIGNQTQSSLAVKLNKSQSSIANKIRLLSLPEEIQDALSNRRISERHARSLLSVTDKERQLELLNKIINERLTVKETEQIINEKEINEEEIKKAINDIMKSLSIEEEPTEDEIKKEKKEDDNMNNGNFFPNFDNNNLANNNPSMNMTNMQTMNQAPINPEPEVVMPTATEPMNNGMNQEQPMMNSIPQFGPPISSPEPMVPVSNEPFFGNMNQAPIMDSPQQNFGPQPNEMPLFGTQTNAMEQPPLNIPPMMNDAPLFGGITSSNEMTGQSTPVDVPQQPPMDIPLFNPNVVMPTVEPVVAPVLEPTNESNSMMQSFEVPVEAPVPTMEPLNKLQELQNLLTSNGYEFKLYGNDTTDCIIIELPRN